MTLDYVNIRGNDQKIYFKDVGVPAIGDGAYVAPFSVKGNKSEAVEFPKEVNGLEICNGPLTFTVLVDRGMEVYQASYNGKNIGWDTPIGEPYHPDDVNLRRDGRLLLGDANQWLPGIGGPLDGFAQLVWKAHPRFGPPDEGEYRRRKGYNNLHGIASYTVADQGSVKVSVLTNDEMDLTPTGEVNLYLVIEGNTRPAGFRNSTTITTKVNGNSFVYRETVRNPGTKEEKPYQFAFHNQLMIGDIVLPTTVVSPRDEEYDVDDINNWHSYWGEDGKKQGEQVFFHRLIPVPFLRHHLMMGEWSDPQTEREDLTASLVFDRGREFGVYNAFRTSQFPSFTQWKVGGPWFIEHSRDVWVFGSEPNNIAKPHEGTYASLAPKQEAVFEQEIGVMPDKESVETLEAVVRNATAGRIPTMVYDERRAQLQHLVNHEQE